MNKLKEFKPDLTKKSLKVYTNTINKILKDLDVQMFLLQTI